MWYYDIIEYYYTVSYSNMYVYIYAPYQLVQDLIL